MNGNLLPLDLSVAFVVPPVVVAFEPLLLGPDVAEGMLSEAVGVTPAPRSG